MNHGQKNDTMLDELVQKSGYKQRFIAAFVNVSDARISRLVNGQAEPTLQECRKICEVLSRGLGREVTIDEVWPPQPSHLPIPTAGVN